MTDNTLHTISRLFLILCIAMLAAMFGSVLSLPYAIIAAVPCCAAVHYIARMGIR